MQAYSRQASILPVRLMGFCLCGLMVAGCTRPERLEQVDRGEQVSADLFLHEHLQMQPMVTVGEAYRAMVLLAEGEDAYDSFEAREVALEERQIVRPQWELKRAEPVDKGTVAYMVMRILKLRGGVNMLLFGNLGLGDRRYALRELAYQGLMEATPTYRFITGGELVNLMLKADRYMADHGMYPSQSVSIPDMLEGGSSAATRPSTTQPAAGF
ncbi:MAG: hypothetical protein AMXMBFR13_33710 [Phycisphaerae bacterium]